MIKEEEDGADCDEVGAINNWDMQSEERGAWDITLLVLRVFVFSDKAKEEEDEDEAVEENAWTNKPAAPQPTRKLRLMNKPASTPLLPLLAVAVAVARCCSILNTDSDKGINVEARKKKSESNDHKYAIKRAQRARNQTYL